MFFMMLTNTVLTFLLLAVSVSAVAAKTTTTTTKAATTLSSPPSLDFSFHHHVKADLLASAIRQHLWDNRIANLHLLDQPVRIDLSNSFLGDDGLKILMDAILPTKSTTNLNDGDSENFKEKSQGGQQEQKQQQDAIAIHLSLRMNQLTHVGVTKLFQTICTRPTPQEQRQKQEEPEPKSREASESETVTSALSLNQNEKGPKDESHLQHEWSVESLDLSWNDLSTGEKTFHRALHQLLADRTRCPHILRLDLCGLGPAACRSIGKGLIQRFDKSDDKSSDDTNDVTAAAKRLTLYLSGNEALGDAGAATLAAAIRTVVTKNRPRQSSNKDDNHDDDGILVLEKLNLSACSIGDAGVEALSLALESHARSVRYLDLSNNRISDTGVAALGRALLLSPRRRTTTSTTNWGLDELDLSNNVDIGDRGAAVLADCLTKGMVKNAVLRSCSVRADGAAAFGRALRQLCQRHSSQDRLPVTVDLSGNALGVLRGKSVNSGKYSASHFKSKASATTASYMNFIGKKIREGLKDVVGVDVSPIMGMDDDEDDEEEGLEKNGKSPNGDFDASEARCGIKAFANAFLDEDDTDTKHSAKEHDKSNQIPLDGATRRCHVSLRHCCLDHAAADALAAAVLYAKDEFGIDLVVDVVLNPVLEDEMVQALLGNGDEYYLREMAERHHDSMAALRQAKQRAKEAAAAVVARVKAEEYESAWDAPMRQQDEEEDEDEETGDSDADYEDEEGAYDEEA